MSHVHGSESQYNGYVRTNACRGSPTFGHLFICFQFPGQSPSSTVRSNKPPNKQTNKQTRGDTNDTEREEQPRTNIKTKRVDKRRERSNHEQSSRSIKTKTNERTSERTHERTDGLRRVGFFGAETNYANTKQGTEIQVGVERVGVGFVGASPT